MNLRNIRSSKAILTFGDTDTLLSLFKEDLGKVVGGEYGKSGNEAVVDMVIGDIIPDDTDNVGSIADPSQV